MDPIEKAEHTMFFNGIYLSCSLKLGSYLEFSIPVLGSFNSLSVPPFYPAFYIQSNFDTLTRKNSLIDLKLDKKSKLGHPTSLCLKPTS